MRFTPIPTEVARALQSGAADANGHRPERHESDGDGVPCRHCLKMVPEGASYLVLSHRPFTTVQPYAESGPIFLCAEPCTPDAASDATPEILSSPAYIVRGYSADERIVYGTGKVTSTAEIPAYARDLLARDEVAFVHVRSAANNCFQVRIDA